MASDNNSEEINVVKFNTIGTIKSPFDNLEGMPIQPVGAQGIKGQIILNEELKDGLKDLDGFSHIILIYNFHKSNGFNLHVKPFLDNELKGVFATRTPKRPNQLGISVVKVSNVQDNIINVENIDILNGTPLLDIKPYIPKFDKNIDDELRLGWFEKKYKNAKVVKSDDRFMD